MCGIFGIVGERASRHAGSSGRRAVEHRGPDAEGLWTDGKVVFAHSRLSILDLSADANQPFFQNEQQVITYNGEIFNFEELRRELATDFQFKTSSDTEVLYRLLGKWGRQGLSRLNGMFAFGYYDRTQRKLLLVRDRFGIKPLYFFHDHRGLIFSSEQKAIYPLIEEGIDERALAEHLSFKCVSGQRTLVRGVSELRPGHWLELDVATNRLSVEQWYEMPREREQATTDLVESTEYLLEDAVRLRLISDVPVGLQLSGGVDSSIIAYLVSNKAGKKLNSYSIGFPGDDQDESKYAEKVSAQLGLNHHPIEFTARDFMELWEQATYHNDEPINHPHSLPIFKLSQVARQDVTVLLSGEGADETFLGYEHHRRYLNLASLKEACAFHQFLPLKVVQQMLGNSALTVTDQLGGRQDCVKGSSAKSGNAKHVVEFSLHLNSLLNRIDKMSMAHAMEIRTPFLDYRIVERGLREKMVNLVGENGDERKRPLMRLYEKFFGDGMSRRKKVGFRVPFDEWLREDFRFREYVIQKILLSEGTHVFASGYVEGLVGRLHRAEFVPSTFREAWVVANFAIWNRVFDEVRQASPSLSGSLRHL